MIQRLTRVNAQIQEFVTSKFQELIHSGMESGRREGIPEDLLSVFLRDAIHHCSKQPFTGVPPFKASAQAAPSKPSFAAATGRTVAPRAPAPAARPAARAVAAAPRAVAAASTAGEAAPPPPPLFEADGSDYMGPAVLPSAGAGGAIAAVPATSSSAPMDWKTLARSAFDGEFDIRTKKDDSIIVRPCKIREIHHAVFSSTTNWLNASALPSLLHGMDAGRFAEWLQDASIVKNSSVYGILEGHIDFFFGENIAESTINYASFTASRIVKFNKGKDAKAEKEQSLYAYFEIPEGSEPPEQILREVALIQTMQHAVLHMIEKILRKSNLCEVIAAPNGLCLHFSSSEAVTAFQEKIKYVRGTHPPLRHSYERPAEVAAAFRSSAPVPTVVVAVAAALTALTENSTAAAAAPAAAAPAAAAPAAAAPAAAATVDA